MKRCLTFFISALILAFATPSTQAFDDHSFEAVAADVLVVRPLSFVATIIGSALFVVSLPVAAISQSTSQTAHALVVKPARATFTRPLGDLSSLAD